MKKFIVKIRFTGLTGQYISDVPVEARTAQAAKKKAERTIGDRDGYVVSILEG